MMKKFLLILGIAGILFAGGSAKADTNRVLEKIVLYPANLVLDALDTFTLNIGFGPVLEARLQATAAIWGGGRVGMSWKMYKAYNRQYGFGTEDGWYWEFVSVGEENLGVLESTSLVNKYTEIRPGSGARSIRFTATATAITGRSAALSAVSSSAISTSTRSTLRIS